jgi:WD40 repeat protein
VVRVWELLAAETQVLPGGEDETSKPAISSDGKRVGWSREDGRVRVVDVDGGKSWQLGGGGETGGSGAQVVFSADGMRVAVTNGEKTMRLFDTSVAPPTMRIVTGDAHAVAAAFSTDGKRVAVSGYEGQPIRIVDVATGDVIALGVPDGRVSALTFSADRQRLVTWGWGAKIQVWDAPAAGGQPGPPKDLEGHSGEVRHVVFSPDGAQLASGGADGTVRTWKLATGAGRMLGSHGAAVNHVVFSPDGTRLASGGDDKSVRIWSLAGGDPRVLRGHTNAVTQVAFSPAGDRLASAGVDGFVRLWDLATGECRVLAGHTQTVWSVAFSGDGRRIATVGGDGTVRVFGDGLPSAPNDLAAWLVTQSTSVIDGEGVLGTAP